MNKGILGIDLGTSSVKAIFVKGNKRQKFREGYDGNEIKAWTDAIRKIISNIDTSEVSAIGLSSQVGTYIINHETIISWNDNIGEKQLHQIKDCFSAEQFINEISMPHPNLISYPIPRLMYIKETYSDIKTVCMPKDYICELLTGNLVTDIYSWRGLTNLRTAEYSRFFLDYIGIDSDVLPKLCMPDQLAGKTVKNSLGLPEGIPVYIGCNDFFSSLIGMGINKPGQLFDITGTSEHIGIITETIIPDLEMINGPYFTENVSYGVTASSGASIDFCLNNFDTDFDITEVLSHNPPIFLPYLNGERAPIWDSNAKGTFFGINSDCTSKELAYSVMEGVVFSLWHIYGYLPKTSPQSLTISGGGAKGKILNQLKAEIFNIPVNILEENDTSALGAVILASVGNGVYDSINSATADLCKVKDKFYPSGKFRNILLDRFKTYVKIYPAVKNIL